jgi:hypothetical protein
VLSRAQPCSAVLWKCVLFYWKHCWIGPDFYLMWCVNLCSRCKICHAELGLDACQAIWALSQFLCVVTTAIAAWWGQDQYRPTRGGPGLQHLQQMVIAAAHGHCSHHPKYPGGHHAISCTMSGLSCADQCSGIVRLLCRISPYTKLFS